jgi:hypothetical protein
VTARPSAAGLYVISTGAVIAMSFAWMCRNSVMNGLFCSAVDAMSVRASRYAGYAFTTTLATGPGGGNPSGSGASRTGLKSIA